MPKPNLAWALAAVGCCLLQPARVDASCAAPGSQVLELELQSVTRNSEAVQDLSAYENVAVTISGSSPGVNIRIESTLAEDQPLTTESRMFFTEHYERP